MLLPRRQPRETGYTPIVTAGERGLRYLSFGLLRLAPGAAWGFAYDGTETVLVLLGGRCEFAAGGQRWPQMGERETVFSPAGAKGVPPRPAALYAPPGCEVEVKAHTDVEVAVCMARAEGGPRPTLIAPDQVGIREVGEGTFRRRIHDIVTAESLPGARLLVGETYNEPGCWSSYPPHKHDADDPPREHALEEVYHYRVDPPEGFGLQRVYGDGFDEAYAAGNGDTAVITQGYHPVAAAPGYRLYYLWMLAGERRELVWREDPAHAWTRNPK